MLEIDLGFVEPPPEPGGGSPPEPPAEPPPRTVRCVNCGRRVPLNTDGHGNLVTAPHTRGDRPEPTRCSRVIVVGARS